MDWFNIVVVLFGQAFLFFYISRMYGKHNKWFSLFSAFFLVLALVNIVVCALMVFLIIGGVWVDKFVFFGNVLFYVQIGFFVMLIIFYVIKLFLDGVEGVSDAIKK